MKPLAGSVARWTGDVRHVLPVLALFVATWTVFHSIVYAPIGLHPDLTEVYGWGRHPLLGYYKHPPLSAWAAGLWFRMFPSTDWAFHLLAMANAAAGLFFADLIARRYLDAGKRAMVIVLLLLTPFYQFFGQKFNANAVLLSTWPLAVYCFLRAFETRSVAWSIAAGAAVALAMLGKYYSVYLVAGIVIAALTHPMAGRYLKSPAPWVSAAAGLAVLAPHAEWLWRTGFQPFDYAYTVHGASSLGNVLIGVPGYLAGAAGYVALLIAVYALIVRPDRRLLRETVWPSQPDRRMLVVMLGAFLVLPALTAPLLNLELTSLWTMQIWFLLPVILLSPPGATVSRRAVTRSVSALVVFTVAAAAIAAPVLSWLNFSRPGRDDRGYYKPLSESVTALWRSDVGRGLPVVIGDNNLASAIEFYSPDHPDAVPFFTLKAVPWVTAQRMQTEGYVAVCNADDVNCVAQARELTAADSRAMRRTIEIVPHFFGYSASPGNFVVIVVPPRALARLGPA